MPRNERVDPVPVLSYASKTTRAPFPWLRLIRAGGIVSALAAVSLVGFVLSLLTDYFWYDGSHYRPWPWIQNDAVFLFLISAGACGVLGILLLLVGHRVPRASRRTWVAWALAVDVLAVLTAMMAAAAVR